MRKIAMLAAAAALVGAPQTASAGDMGGSRGGSMKDAPPPIMITNWTGFFSSAGAGAGAFVGTYNFSDDTTWLVDGANTFWHESRTAGGDGAFFSGQLGYDYLFPASRWLVGAFVDYDWDNFSADRHTNRLNKACVDVQQVCSSADHTKLTLQDQWNIGGRVGVLTSPETLFYFLLAYTQANEKASLDNWLDSEGAVWRDLNGSVALDGLTVGTGLETHLGDSWFLKLEYRFSQLGSDTAWERTFGVRTQTASEHIWTEVDANVHTARIALAYKLARSGHVESLKSDGAAPADPGGSMKDAPPPPLVVKNWTGFYLGGGVGFGAAIDSYKFSDEAQRNDRSSSYWHDFWTAGGDSALFTAQMGYDYHFHASRWLVGVFVDYDFGSFGASRDTASWDGAFLDSHRTGITFQDQWNLGGRVGFLTSPETALYVLLAYTQANAKTSLDNWLDCELVTWGDLHGVANLEGATVGAGLETHLRSNWFLKLEYRFSQFASATAWDHLTGPRVITATERLWTDIDADVHTARLALTYKATTKAWLEPLK